MRVRDVVGSTKILCQTERTSTSSPLRLPPLLPLPPSPRPPALYLRIEQVTVYVLPPAPCPPARPPPPPPPTRRSYTCVLSRLQSMCCPLPVSRRCNSAAMMAPKAYNPVQMSVRAMPTRHGSPPYKHGTVRGQHRFRVTPKFNIKINDERKNTMRSSIKPGSKLIERKWRSDIPSKLVTVQWLNLTDTSDASSPCTGVWGLGCLSGVQGLGCLSGVWGLGCLSGVWGLGCLSGVWGLRCLSGARGLGCLSGVWGLGCLSGVWGLGCLSGVWGLGCLSAGRLRTSGPVMCIRPPIAAATGSYPPRCEYGPDWPKPTTYHINYGY